MDSIDALGSRPERLSAFTGKLLSETEDEELNAIVKEAARDLSTPIALVNLVLEHLQFFKAHHGLPEDLVAARGTDRDVSFCQFVVREGEPFEVVDAEQDERVPQHLVRHYGIRAYLGMPIMANDTIVGSLCVIDFKPREFTEEERQALKKLAGLVNTRLATLAGRRPKPGPRKRELVPALTELRKAIAPIREEVLAGRTATTAIAAFLRLMDYALAHEVVPPPVIEQTLHAAREALASSRDRYYDIDVSVDHAQSSLAVLENILKLSSATSVLETAEAAIELMAPVLEPIGGASLEDRSKGVAISTSRAFGVSILSTSLALVAAELGKQGPAAGLQLEISPAEDGQVIVSIRAARLSEKALQEIAAKLIGQLGDGISVAARYAVGAVQVGFAVAPED